MRHVALVLALLATPAAASALDNPFPDATIVSPGIKLGYTFGDSGGFTFGLELSILVRTGPDLTAVLAHGPALNLSWTTHGIFQARVGWQLVSWILGLEAGPSLVTGRDGTHFALGVTPWLGGIFVVPYYTHAIVLGGSNIQELGTYLKLPICAGCESSGGGSHWGDFDDLD